MSEIKTIFNISQSILAYIYQNEPIDEKQINDLIVKSKLEREKVILNIERLHDAGLLRGGIIINYPESILTNSSGISLSYAGMKELSNLITSKPNKLNNSILKIDIGELNFPINLLSLGIK